MTVVRRSDTKSQIWVTANRHPAGNRINLGRGHWLESSNVGVLIFFEQPDQVTSDSRIESTKSGVGDGDGPSGGEGGSSKA